MLKGGLVLIWELHMNLVLTLLYKEKLFQPRLNSVPDILNIPANFQQIWKEIQLRTLFYYRHSKCF